MAYDVSELKKLAKAGGAGVSVVAALVKKGPWLGVLFQKAPALLALGEVKWPEVLPEATDLDEGESKDLVASFFEGLK